MYYYYYYFLVYILSYPKPTTDFMYTQQQPYTVNCHQGVFCNVDPSDKVITRSYQMWLFAETSIPILNLRLIAEKMRYPAIIYLHIAFTRYFLPNKLSELTDILILGSCRVLHICVIEK